MNQPIKLSEGELSAIRAQEYPTVIDDNGKPWYVNQIDKLASENKRLHSCLKAFYFDTMYKDNPGLHDLACDLLAPYDEEFAEVKRNKESDNG